MKLFAKLRESHRCAVQTTVARENVGRRRALPDEELEMDHRDGYCGRGAVHRSTSSVVDTVEGAHPCVPSAVSTIAR